MGAGTRRSLDSRLGPTLGAERLAATDETEVQEELSHVPQMGDAAEPDRVSRRAWIGRFIGPVLALLFYVLLPTG